MDIAITYNDSIGGFDWSFTNGDLTTAPDIETAVIVSLFSDRRAPNDYQPADGTQDRRGCWLDSYDTSPTGSRLWTLQRTIVTDGPQVPLSARNYCLEALAWLKSTGVVATIDVQTAWATTVQDILAIQVTVTEPNSAQTTTYKWAWNMQPASASVVINQPVAYATGVLLDENFVLGTSKLY